VKLTPLTLLFVCAAPARADVAVKLPPTWRDRCADRLEAAATEVGLSARARRDTIPLLREDGSPNPMQLVQLGGGDVLATVGNETELRKDKPWHLTTHGGVHGKAFPEWFRRAHGMFATLKIGGVSLEKPFKAALDECLQMGESK
jgi:hypothetical protein